PQDISQSRDRESGSGRPKDACRFGRFEAPCEVRSIKHGGCGRSISRWFSSLKRRVGHCSQNKILDSKCRSDGDGRVSECSGRSPGLAQNGLARSSAGPSRTRFTCVCKCENTVLCDELLW